MRCAGDIFSVGLEGHSYLVVVLADLYYWENESSSRQLIRKVFAGNLGDKGMVLASTLQRVEENARRVLSKSWPDDSRRRLERREPKLVVADTTLRRFDPEVHPFRIIYLPESEDAARITLRHIEEGIPAHADREKDYQRA